jgi:hypothetical protein
VGVDGGRRDAVGEQARSRLGFYVDKRVRAAVSVRGQVQVEFEQETSMFQTFCLDTLGWNHVMQYRYAGPGPEANERLLPDSSSCPNINTHIGKLSVGRGFPEAFAIL